MIITCEGYLCGKDSEIECIECKSQFCLDCCHKVDVVDGETYFYCPECGAKSKLCI